MKARKTLLWVVGVPAAIYAILFVARFQTTLPIEGVLVDAKTGKPVSKALVHVNWFFTYPGLVDTSSGGFGFGTFTDEEGRFRIPRKNATAALGRFIDQSLMIKHPLYEFLDKPIYAPWDKGKEYRLGTVEGGALRLTLPIMSLEDKYSKPEDVDSFARVIDDCGPDFYLTMRDHYSIRYDIDQVMTTLKRLAARFPGGPDYQINHAYRAYLAHEIQVAKLKNSY